MHLSQLSSRTTAARRTSTEHSLITWDSSTLFYRAWIPEQPATKTVLLFHRGHEHSARWQETVEALDMPDTAFFAWDQRGHGRSPGARGHAPSLSALTKDADCFARHLVREHGVHLEQTAIVASSVGGVIAAAWVHDFALPVRALVLAAPAFRVKLYVPLAVSLLRLKERFRPGGCVSSYVKSRMLTHDPEQAAAYDADPLIFRNIAINLLLDLHDTGIRLIDDAGAICTPTLILAAEKDWVVQIPAQAEFFRNLGSPVKQMEVLPGFSHSIFHEKERGRVVERVRRFLDECFARPPAPGNWLEADRGGITRTEYDLLRMPDPPRWRFIRAGLKTGGRLSNGIRLGWRSGFDSGLTLDYIYENKPRGLTPIGKIIDFLYLNAVGWRGIRLRQQNLSGMLESTIRRVHGAGSPVHILDIAAGPGRYVLETMRRLKDIPASATLRDYKPENLEAARQLARELDVQNVEMMYGDAFNRRSLATQSPRPKIAIVSGLYELIPDNAPVLESLRGIADAMDPGGYLLYTGQPWHPQVEFIARALVNREGRPWVMRRRTQAEMDALVRAAGFEKIEQDIDPWGIFTVSLAVRVRA